MSDLLAEALHVQAAALRNSDSAPVLAHLCAVAGDRITELCAENERLMEALSFYANVGIYHGCSFMFDRPTGGYDEDFDDDHGDPFYDRPMPGKLARQALGGGQP